jgi:hypothetical protein
VSLMEIGRWIRVLVKDQGDFIGFTYVEPQAGFSARGWMGESGGSGGCGSGEGPQTSAVTLRAPDVFPQWQHLTEAEIEKDRLPLTPEWLSKFGSQAPSGTPWGIWRSDPGLSKHFHPQLKDDVQVLVHDGGPKLSQTKPEALWVRVDQKLEPGLFSGRVLNAPHELAKVAQFERIQFVAEEGSEFPIQVREAYLDERSQWSVEGCKRCGSTVLFDAPSDLIAGIFPSAEVEPVSFTTFCGLCGGVQLVSKSEEQEEG